MTLLGMDRHHLSSLSIKYERVKTDVNINYQIFLHRHTFFYSSCPVDRITSFLRRHCYLTQIKDENGHPIRSRSPSDIPFPGPIRFFKRQLVDQPLGVPSNIFPASHRPIIHHLPLRLIPISPITSRLSPLRFNPPVKEVFSSGNWSMKLRGCRQNFS